MPNLVILVFNLIQQYLLQERIFPLAIVTRAMLSDSREVTKTSQAKYDAREYWPWAFFALVLVPGSLPVLELYYIRVFNYQTWSRSSLKMLNLGEFTWS